MILDLDCFARTRQPGWNELTALLDRIAMRSDRHLEPGEAESLLDLYHQAAADLNRLEHGAPASSLQSYLHALVARAYAEVYAEPRSLHQEFAGWRLWPRRFGQFFLSVPLVFRRHLRLFWLALGLTLVGCCFGALAVILDPAATNALLPAAYLRNPAQRVAQDLGQAAGGGRPPLTLSDETAFSAQLITHNIQVGLLALALGVTLGIGTGLLLFENGVLLGAVAARYSQQGFAWFVSGWLLPHGAFEIPSVLIAGQAGFLLAGLLLGGGREPRWQRIRRQLPDLLTLLGGLCCLLIWAGIMEAFFSQHHARGAYGAQVAVGLCELLLLGAYLTLSGRRARAA